MQSSEKLFTLENPAINEILLSVRPVVYGHFGVFADEALIGILESQAAAEARCRYLIQLQAQVRGANASPHRRQRDRAGNADMLDHLNIDLSDT
jgi:hypothetical protein